MEPCFSIASSGSVANISAPTITVSNSFEPIMQFTMNEAHKINDQLKDALIEKTYLVVLQSSIQ